MSGDKSLGGRPPIFETPEEMDALVDAYVEAGDVLTVTGLALKLGFASKQSIYDYAKKPEFSYSIKRALLLVENGYEKKLFSATPTGSIFALKNMGWKDEKKLEHSGGVTIIDDIK